MNSFGIASDVARPADADPALPSLDLPDTPAVADFMRSHALPHTG